MRRAPSSGWRRRPGWAGEPAEGRCPAWRPCSLRRPGPGEKPRSGAPSDQAGPCVLQGTEPEPRTRPQGEGRGSRRVKGARPAPPQRPPARLSRLAVRRPRQAPGKAKASAGSRLCAGDSCVTPALIPVKKRLRGEESLNLQPRSGACLGSFLPQPTCTAPEAVVHAAPLRGRRGEALRTVRSAPANGWTARAAA